MSGCQLGQCQLQSSCSGPTCREAGASQTQPAFVDSQVALRWEKRRSRDHTTGRLVPIGPCYCKRPRETVPTRRPQDFRGFRGLHPLAHGSMRFTALLILASLAGALVCACEYGPSPAPILRTPTCIFLPLLGRGSFPKSVSAAFYCFPPGSPHKGLCPDQREPGTLQHPLALSCISP